MEDVDVIARAPSDEFRGVPLIDLVVLLASDGSSGDPKKFDVSAEITAGVIIERQEGRLCGTSVVGEYIAKEATGQEAIALALSGAIRETVRQVAECLNTSPRTKFLQ